MGKSIASIKPLAEKPQLYDINTEPQAATYLQLSQRYLLRLRKQGKIGFNKFGAAVRYTSDHVLKYIKDNEQTQQE